MISEEELKEAVAAVLGSVESGVRFGDLADGLNSASRERSIRLSAYGFAKWAVERHGGKALYRNVLSSQDNVAGYVNAAVRYRDDMPSMLLSAHEYAEKLLANIGDVEICLKQMEGMSFPYVMYILFAGSGQPEIVECYRDEAAEHIRRYPDTLALLPEGFKAIGRALEDADA